MKIKNYYAWICPIWIIATICEGVACVVSFVEGNFFMGFLWIVLSLAFSFESGVLLEKAVKTYYHNKNCDN